MLWKYCSLNISNLLLFQKSLHPQFITWTCEKRLTSHGFSRAYRSGLGLGESSPSAKNRKTVADFRREGFWLGQAEIYLELISIHAIIGEVIVITNDRMRSSDELPAARWFLSSEKKCVEQIAGKQMRILDLKSIVFKSLYLFFMILIS